MKATDQYSRMMLQGTNGRGGAIRRQLAQRQAAAAAAVQSP